MTDEHVASTLDLREEPSECKRPATRKVLSGIFKAPVWVRERGQPLCARAALSDVKEHQKQAHRQSLSALAAIDFVRAACSCCRIGTSCP